MDRVTMEVLHYYISVFWNVAKRKKGKSAETKMAAYEFTYFGYLKKKKKKEKRDYPCLNWEKLGFKPNCWELESWEEER